MTDFTTGGEPNTMNVSAMAKRIAELEAKLAVASDRKLSLKVTDKGGVSLYGLGRFPVTLYASQWDKLISAVDQIKAFVDTNRALLSTKD